MSKDHPSWIVQDLVKLLGFDDETVKEALVPELDGYKHEVKLRSYLQDFLGPTPAAKQFTAKYLAYRFPNIASSSSSLPTPSDSPSLKPKPSKDTQKRGTSANPSARNDGPTNIDEALFAAFGGGGKVYQKNREADDTAVRRGGSGAGSGRVSGSSTPAINPPRQPVPVRSGGALTVHEVKAQRVDSGGGGSGGGKKGKEKIWDVPKSKEVKKLEGIMEDLRGLQAGEGKVMMEKEVPDCFCQVRIHPLSTYTPFCSHCALIICQLHPPQYPCPSCHNPLLGPAQLARLLNRIQSQIDNQLAREQSARDEEERERLARLAAESGGGAFPTLNGMRSGMAQNADGSRKVLTIGKGKGKGKATLTTTTYRPSPAQSGPSTPAQPTTPPPIDIVPQPRATPLDAARIEKELNKVLAWRELEDRPWGDMKADKKGEVWQYVEADVPEVLADGHTGRRKNAKKRSGEGKGLDGRVVPGAA